MNAQPASSTLVEPVPLHPVTARPASAAQGILLLAGSSMPAMATVLIAPVLPAIGQEFAQEPAAAVLTPLIASAPALLVGILSPIAGLVIERLGAKRVLLAALIAYAILGVAPALLNGLVPIIITRLAVGAAEGFIMTCCTALIASYFVRERRLRYLSLQAVVSSLSATAFLALGGLLGSFGWRAPFWVYAVALVLAFVAWLLLWPKAEPTPTRSAEARAERLSPRALLLPMAFSFVAAIIFFVPIIQLPYLLVAAGTTEPSTIGLIAALVSLATALGAFVYPFLVRVAAAPLVRAGAFLLAGLGLIGVLVAPGTVGVAASLAVTSLGMGALLPGLVSWAIHVVPASRRGQGIGWWWASFYIGQFLSPLVVVALGALLGGLAGAVVAIGAVSLATGIVLLVLRPARQETSAASTAAEH